MTTLTQRTDRQNLLYGYELTVFDPSGASSTYIQESINVPVYTFLKASRETPGYHRKVKLGLRLPMNYFDQRTSSQTPILMKGFGRTTSGGHPATRNGTRINDLGGWSSPDYTNIHDELNLKVLNRAKDSSFNAPIFLAEAGKTTDMVVSRIADIRQLARQLRRGDVGSFLRDSKVLHDKLLRRRRIPGLPDYPSDTVVRKVERKFNQQFGRDAQIAAGNLWLEWKYGWQSVMHDIVGLSEQLDEIRSQDVNLTTKLVTTCERRWDEKVHNATIEVSPGSKGTRIITYAQKAKVICEFRINDPELVLPSKVGLTNPLSVAWELIPFSFVVDWFIPIGNYIDALDTQFLYTFSDKVRSSREIKVTSWEVTQSDLFNVSVSGSGQHLNIDKRRDIPNINLSFNSIVSKNGFANPERLFTSLALLGQTLSGFRRS